MKIKLIRKIKQRIRDISNVWSVAGIRNVYVMAILPHFGSKSTRDIRRERKQLHIPADTRSAFPVISVQSPVSIQCCWQS